MSTPESMICICSGVRLDNRYQHTIYFDNKTAQEHYFASKTVKSFHGYSFLRKSWAVQVEATMEQAKKWNYLYFRNSASGKTYYYFINQIEYKNDTVVELSLELDVMQTYLFDYDLLDCFIDRQHTLTDNIGDNIIDEGLSTGELYNQSSWEINMGELCILTMSTVDLTQPFDDGEYQKVTSTYYDGIFGGAGIYATNASEWSALGRKLHSLDEEGLSDCVVAIWMYPKKLVQLFTGETWDAEDTVHKIKAIEPFYQYIQRPEFLADGYKPKNNKLFTYPYCMLYATNNAGVAATYNYELFGNPAECGFKITGALSPEGVVRMYPLNYAGEQHSYESGMNLSNYPNCAWNQDVYKLWLAQNQNQQNLSMGVGVVSLVAGAITTFATSGAGATVGLGLMASGATAIAGTLAQRADQSIQPPQSKGSHSANVNVVAGFQAFSLKSKTLTEANARIIDNYFSMYGYKINNVQKPCLKARQSYTYIKTIGCKIAGQMCNEDIVKIEEIFDNGITFWVNGDDIGDYSVNNNVLEV